MKVPYAKKWQKETDKLRQIAIDCDLTEELKWGKPCFTFLKKDVAIVIPLKESCAFSFFKGHCSKIQSKFSKGLESIRRPGDGLNSPRFGRLRPYDRPCRTTFMKPSNWRNPGRR